MITLQQIKECKSDAESLILLSKKYDTPYTATMICVNREIEKANCHLDCDFLPIRAYLTTMMLRWICRNNPKANEDALIKLL